MTARSTQVNSNHVTYGCMVSAKKPGVRLIAHFALLCCAYAAFGSDVEVYPYEPVVVAIPHNAVHMDPSYLTDMIVTHPGGQVTTNQISRAHFLGVSAVNSLFLCMDAQTQLFTTPGGYQVNIEQTACSVVVMPVVGLDTNVVHILDSWMLPRVMLLCGRDIPSVDTKTKFQQILSLSPDGNYAKYAATYLAIDDLYGDLAAMYESATEPVFSSVGDMIVSLATPDGPLKWTVLYHKGYAYGMRQDKVNAINTFTTLTNCVQSCQWSENAEEFLVELAE